MRVIVVTACAAMLVACGTNDSQHKTELKQYAQALSAADSAGDRAKAVALLDGVTASLRRLNDTPDTTLRGCQLAAAHLAEGVAAVAEGGRWSAKDRFESALSSCA